MRRGDILYGDAHRFVKRDFAGTGSSGLGPGKNFADLSMNVIFRDRFVFDCKKNIPALGHDRFAGIHHDFGARQRGTVNLTEIRPVGADGVDVHTGL